MDTTISEDIATLRSVAESCSDTAIGALNRLEVAIRSLDYEDYTTCDETYDGYGCTLRPGHSGDHSAQGTPVVYKTWSSS